MKKSLHACIFILFTMITVHAQTDFDFDVTIASLYKNSEQQIFPQKGSNFILDGTIENIQVHDYTPETFYASLTLLQAKWIGTEKVEVYRIILDLKGPQFAPMFPRRPRPPLPDYVLVQNERILVYCAYSEQQDGFLIFNGISIRKL